MLIETFAAYNFANKKENFTSVETWDEYMIISAVLYALFIFIWVYTIIHSIKSVQRKGGSKNSTVSLLTPLFSWPFYWLFRYSKVI